MIWIVLSAVLLLFPRTRKYGLTVALALVVGAIICNLTLKPLVERIRPYELVGLTNQLLIDPPSDFSFPSGHTTSSFAAASALVLDAGQRVAGRCCSGGTHRFFASVSLRPLSDGCDRRRCDGSGVRTGSLCAGLENAEKRKYRQAVTAVAAEKTDVSAAGTEEILFYEYRKSFQRTFRYHPFRGRSGAGCSDERLYDV